MSRTKKQILFIHGGMTFAKRRDFLRWLKTREIYMEKGRRWRHQYLDAHLGKVSQIIRPEMPTPDNARYEDWQIHLERYLPLLKNNIILIGESLGGIFLAKYLSENIFPKKIRAVYLVCPPFDNTLPGEELSNGFHLKSDLSKIEKNCRQVTLMFSHNDDVVPVSHAKKYARKLPNAKIVIYRNKNGHFQVPIFPEIVRMIKKDLK